MASTPSAIERKSSGLHSSMDLQLAVLRHLPTPILVLSSERTVVFANRAGQRLLASRDPAQPSGEGIMRSSLADLGIKLLYNRTWATVLDRLESASAQEGEGEGEAETVHEVNATVSNSVLSYGAIHFLILISLVTTDDGQYFMLSFERSAHAKRTALPHSGNEANDVQIMSAVAGNGFNEVASSISRIKRAVFDSHTTAGFILTVDENLYLANSKAREVFGDFMLGGAQGCDGMGLRARMEVWDEHFTRRLDTIEFPGMKLVRAKETFTGYRCGFIHAESGDKIVCSIDGECLYDDETGEFLGGICWSRDIEEYSDFLVDQQQRRLESHETICNLMPHLVWTVTMDGTCDWFSERWYKFTGLTKEESVGDKYMQAVHPDDLPRLLAAWDRHRITGDDCDVEIRYRRYDGVYRWLHARACPLQSDDGKILKWYGTSTDIHDLVMARNEAARNKLQMLTVLAHAEVNLFAIDKNRVITMAEGGMQWDSEADTYDVDKKATMIGLDAIEVAQQTQPGGIPGYEQNVLDVLSGKVGVAQSEDAVGKKFFRTRVVADLEHNAADGGMKPKIKGVLGLTIDVTDMRVRTALELDNKKLVLEEQAAKDSNQMKSQFLANMSHEMRTPTAGVIGMVELLSDDDTLTTEQREYVCSIHLSAKALLTIVNDILDFSKIESGRLDIETVPFHLSSVVGELCKLLGMFAHQKGLDFVYDNSIDEELEILGDPGRTRQVLSNLLTNALKFTREGTVKLTVTSTPIEFESAEDTIKVKFLIEDTGIGIEKKVLDKLFMPFSQGDSSTARLYGGTGLGLTISRNLAILMQGSINLESTPGVGSRATFIVPFKLSSWRQDPRQETITPSPKMGLHTTQPPLYQPGHSQSSDFKQRNLDIQLPTTANSLYTTGRSVNSTLKPPLSHLKPEQRSRIHVLVVEDNPINQTIAIKNIRKLGFLVTAVWNGREALSYLLSPSPSQPRPSIILMDVQMPVMDGYEATRILRTSTEYGRERDEGVGLAEEGEWDAELEDAKGKDIYSVGRGKEGEERGKVAEKTIRGRGRGYLREIPVIAMTASAIQGDREKCFDAGMDDYLAKPVEKGRLEEMLVKWAGKKRVFTESKYAKDVIYQD
ncbi:hsp90-like protein [Diplocarpon rosae]|nr:hsp90-like protein [Diplocarpon rosae]